MAFVAVLAVRAGTRFGHPAVEGMPVMHSDMDRSARSVARIVAVLAALAIGACAEHSAGRDDGASTTAAAVPRPSIIRDDFGDTIRLDRRYSRIVSLNNTTTEALFALGAGDRLIGRSHWDQWPKKAQRLPDLGPAIRPNLEVVLSARPDLVLLYASADNRPVAERLRAAGIATFATRVDAIESFRQTTRALGRLVGDESAARVVIDSVDQTLRRVRARTATLSRPTVLIPTWESPLIVIGGGSHMSELVDIAGGRNVYADRTEPAPQVSFEDVVRRDPDVILTSPQGRTRIVSSSRWRALRAVQRGHVFAYDTMVVGRPSVTLGAAAVHFAQLLDRVRAP